MAKTRKLIVDVIADASKFTKELTKADGYSKRLKGSMVALGKSMALGVGAAGVAAAAFGKSALDAAIEAEKAQKGVEATIKSTGGAAGVTAKQIDKFASKMQFKTGIDDEAIKKSQSLLLAFAAVRNESGKGNAIFNRASVAMLDLGKKLGSTDSAAKALGQALTDPVTRLRGLRSAGVSLNETQKETIKNLVESGDLLGAQKIVLAEVEKATGGYAESQVTAGDQAKLAFSEIQEKIGAGLLPVAERLSTWVVDTLIPAVQKFWKTHGPKIVAVFNDLKKAVEKIADTLGPVVVAALREFGKFVKDNSAAIATGIGIVAVALGAYAIAAGASAIASFAAAAGAVAMQIALSPAIGTIALASAAILGMLAALAATGDLFPFLRDATKSWVDRIKAIPDGFRAVWRELVPIANDIVGVVEGFVNRSIDAINLLIRGINAIKPGEDIGEIRRITIARFEQTGIPEMPYLRRVGRPFGEGGIVTRATDAIVGERGPEAIIPLERLGIGRPAAPTNINITVNASPLSNPAEVGAAVVDALKAYERRNGAIPVKVA